MNQISSMEQASEMEWHIGVTRQGLQVMEGPSVPSPYSPPLVSYGLSRWDWRNFRRRQPTRQTAAPESWIKNWAGIEATFHREFTELGEDYTFDEMGYLLDDAEDAVHSAFLDVRTRIPVMAFALGDSSYLGAKMNLGLMRAVADMLEARGQQLGYEITYRVYDGELHTNESGVPRFAASFLALLSRFSLSPPLIMGKNVERIMLGGVQPEGNVVGEVLHLHFGSFLNAFGEKQGAFTIAQ